MKGKDAGHGREGADDAQAPTLLALETSTAACSVALSLRGVVREDHRIVPREHNRLILPMVDALLRAHGVERRDVDAIAFGRGPGSFTGVRIAAGVAQGISLGIGVPVVAVSSLAALAQVALASRPDIERVLATIRSRPDEIYYAVYRRDGELCELIGDESIATSADRDLPEDLDGGCWVVGDGAAHHAARIAELRCAVDATLLPSARGVVQLARRAFANGDFVDSAGALPVYLQGTRPWRKLAE